MRILSLLILSALLIEAYQRVQSPHGPEFKVSCKTCHSTKGWQLDKEIYSFDHNRTKLPLSGQHTSLNCKECHPTLVFSQAKSNCSDCHHDVHQTTVGNDCARCHTPVSWLVSNITEIHQMSRFPLLGPHRTADCIQCHKSENPVRFDVLGVNCIDCHRSNLLATTNPNHVQAGFSQDCSSCHPVNSFQWTGPGFDHSFFPLVLGHSVPKCADCHTTGNYSSTSPDCFSCHLTDYNNSANPGHVSLNFSHTCTDCHTTTPGWKPAAYKQHDSQFFPIYSGSHNGKWKNCTDCHTNAASYAQFNCIVCHANAHRGSNYTNAQCYQCHPTGRGD